MLVPVVGRRSAYAIGASAVTDGANRPQLRAANANDKYLGSSWLLTRGLINKNLIVAAVVV
jgi:hypothetical protein